MSFLSRLFSNPDALTVSDWLNNMCDAFTKRGLEIVEKSPSSPDMLVYFTLVNSTAGTYNTLHIAPRSVQDIGLIYREYRLYYECLWQLTLIAKYDTEKHRDKIAKLYGDVEFRTKAMLKTLFDENQGIGRLLRCVNANDYRRYLFDAVRMYIQGELPNILVDIDDPLQANALALSNKLLKILDRRHIPVESEKLDAQVIEDTLKSLETKVLTKFDLENCTFLEFSDSAYDP